MCERSRDEAVAGGYRVLDVERADRTGDKPYRFAHDVPPNQTPYKMYDGLHHAKCMVWYPDGPLPAPYNMYGGQPAEIFLLDTFYSPIKRLAEMTE